MGGRNTNATTRLAGQNCYQTSVQIADNYIKNSECSSVILASGSSYPDALSASILSKKLNAPILLTNTTAGTSIDAFNFIASHLSTTGTIYIVGGTGVIGADFNTKLASLGYSKIIRVGGANRYNTNMQIVNTVNVPQGTPVFIASGESFPDALSVASFSGYKQFPTLLAGPDYLPQDTISYLRNEQPSTVYITGGTSVVSQDLANQIKNVVPSATVMRLGGSDRFGTNAAVLKKFAPNPKTIYIASGNDFPDVLAGSALAAKTGDPIFLVNNRLTTLPHAAEDYLQRFSGLGISPSLIAIGGPNVISDLLYQQVEDDLSSSNCSIPNQGNHPKNTYARIAVAFGTAYYLDSIGHVWAWGEDDSGQLDNGTTGTVQLNPSDTVNPVYGSTVPVEVSKLSNIVSIAAGRNSCYALDRSGHVWAWGQGDSGQLGNGTTGSQLDFEKNTPYGSTVPVEVANINHIVSITAGESTGYALDSSGRVWAWGSCQFGTPNGLLSSDVPIQVPDLTNIVSIAADSVGTEAFAFDNAGHVWAWGYFGSGVSIGWADSQPTIAGPVLLTNLKDSVALAYEGLGTSAIWRPTSGNVWGTYTDDQLWYALDRLGQVWAWEFYGSKANDGIINTPVKVANLSNIVAIVGRGEDFRTDIYNSGYALDRTGHVWAWGDGTLDELGNNGTVNQYLSVPVRLPILSNVVEIAGNNGDGYALDNDGNVWSYNFTGVLSNGQPYGSGIPVRVLGLPK